MIAAACPLPYIEKMPGTLTRKEWNQVIQFAEDTTLHRHDRDPDDIEHGKPHWESVAMTGAALAQAEKVDPRLATIFGLVHDCCRENDASDPDHGFRAAKLVESTPLFTNLLGHEGAALLAKACALHNEPERHGDPRIGVCLDADRLSLGRVGTEVKEEYLSTVSASRLVRGHANLSRQGEPSVFHAYHGSHRLGDRQAPSQGNIIYAALDEESAAFYGETRGLLVSARRLADLTDPMALIRTPIFDQLKEHDQSNSYYNRESGEKVSVFDFLEAGDFYHTEGRRGQESFISEVMGWGYDAVLINDISHSAHPTLAVSPAARMVWLSPVLSDDWKPPVRERDAIPSIGNASLISPQAQSPAILR
jgi:uncharacterized protein